MPHNSVQISGISYEKLLKYSFSLLAKKRYTGLEITKKLQQYIQRRSKFSDNTVDGAFAEASKEPLQNEAVRVLQRFPKDSGPVDAVIDRLTELKYIDDLQYAKDYLEHRIKFKPRGKFLLTRELTQRGIDKAVVNNLWEQSGVDEADVAIEALQKWQKSWPGISGQKLRERAYRFLAGKGFKADAIYKAIGSCYNPSIK